MVSDRSCEMGPEQKPRIYQLTEVFNEAGVPILTFVPPREFSDLVGSLRTSGKHVTLSGPSGCGKTTIAYKALAKAGVNKGGYEWISGRDYSGLENWIEVFAKGLHCSRDEEDVLDNLMMAGIFVIDDFHHLNEAVRTEIGNKLKRWSELGIRIFLIGIAGVNKRL